MSSPSSSSSGTAGARRSSHPSRSTALSWVAAALVAATLCVPFALLFVAGLFGLLTAVVGGVAALAFYFRVAPPGAFVPVLSGVALNVGASALAFIAFLVSGCSGPAGHVDGPVWTAGAVVALVVGTWALLRPRRAWWGMPLATLLAAGLVIGLATALTGNTGLCPD